MVRHEPPVQLRLATVGSASSGRGARVSLKTAYALRDRSKEQVDYLISLCDPLGLCPQDLCKLFGVGG